MSQSSLPPTSLPSAISNPITEDDIANYLVHSPDFFERHAALLATVQLSNPHNQRAVSLQERQAVMLRDKIKLLEARIMEMIRNANDNTLLSDKLLLWAQTLFLNDDPQSLPELMVEEIAGQFAVPQVAIKVWGVAPVFAECAFAQDVTEDDRQFVQSLTEPYCGVNSGLELARWLPKPQLAESLAILPLRELGPDSSAAAFGALVLASPDSQRFTSSMGTDFLIRMADLTSAALSRLR